MTIGPFNKLLVLVCQIQWNMQSNINLEIQRLFGLHAPNGLIFIWASNNKRA